MFTIPTGQQTLNLANTLECVFTAFAIPCLQGSIEFPPKRVPTMERHGVMPAFSDGGLVCLWFGELVAFMRDRTLYEGNDFG